MAQMTKTAQRDKCSVGQAKQTVRHSVEWMREVKPSSCLNLNFSPYLTETLSECHVTSLHYASPSPVQREDWWRPLWGEKFHGGWRRPPSRPLQSTNNTSASPSTLLWQGDTFWGEHFPRHSPSCSRRRSSALIPPQVYVEERHTTHRRRILQCDVRSVWPHSPSVLRGGWAHRPDGGAL